jgi:hypothetical protein
MSDEIPTDETDSGSNNDRGARGELARRALRLTRKSGAQSSPPGAAGSRAQQVLREGVAAVGKKAAERVGDAARKGKAASRPGLSRVRDRARKWSALEPDVKQQVVASLLTAAAVSAGERMKAHSHPGVKLAGLGLAAAAPAVATHAGRQVGRLGKSAGPAAEPDEASIGTEQAGEAGMIGAQEPWPSSGALEPELLDEYADKLGVRPPPDPEELYREGTTALELVYPLPEGLAALPWDSLSRRNRFFVLVAAWALREADGVQLLKAGDLEQAREAFQECLIRAQHMQTPELVARSCEDLGELAVVSGDEAGTREWRAEAGRAISSDE